MASLEQKASRCRALWQNKMVIEKEGSYVLMKRTGKLIYKCRVCSELFTTKESVKDLRMVLDFVSIYLDGVKSSGPMQIQTGVARASVATLHQCSKGEVGTVGLADIVGGTHDA